MNMFRTLRADEIDCRISQIKDDDGKPTGLTLLLYKDARCDQNILDETVGPMNWKREHTRDNRNCIVSLWDSEKGQWIGKEDTGTESNTEKEKGLASDSFKRACFNWGVGRELYTAPFVWVPADKCNIKKNKYGKMACYDNFTVSDIDYLDGNICYLVIKNNKTGKVCYTWGERGKAEERTVEPDNEPSNEASASENKNNVDVEKTNTLPPQAQPNPVSNYLINEITSMQEIWKMKNYGDAKAKFNECISALVDAKIIGPVDWKTVTMEEAHQIVSAVKANFVKGDAA